MTVLYPQRRNPASVADVHGIGYLRSLLQATSAAVTVIVCTAGVWSVEVSFAACDDFRIEFDGPAADNVRASATVEFEED